LLAGFNLSLLIFILCWRYLTTNRYPT